MEQDDNVPAPTQLHTLIECQQLVALALERARALRERPDTALALRGIVDQLDDAHAALSQALRGQHEQ
jgi:hypothetical protein